MCGVWCVVCGVNLPFWLKFKWRMAHSRNRGTWNREPPSPLSIRGLVVYSLSPIHLFFNSIPSLPPPLRATSRQYHTFHSPIHPHFHLCNLPASSTSPQHPTFHSPIHPHFQLCNLPASSTSPQHPTFHSAIHRSIHYLHLCNLPASSTSPHHPTFHSPIHPHLHLCNLPASSTSPQHPTLHSPSIRTSPSCATTAA